LYRTSGGKAGPQEKRPVERFGKRRSNRRGKRNIHQRGGAKEKRETKALIAFQEEKLNVCEMIFFHTRVRKREKGAERLEPYKEKKHQFFGSRPGEGGDLLKEIGTEAGRKERVGKE